MFYFEYYYLTFDKGHPHDKGYSRQVYNQMENHIANCCQSFVVPRSIGVHITILEYLRGDLMSLTFDSIKSNCMPDNS